MVRIGAYKGLFEKHDLKGAMASDNRVGMRFFLCVIGMVMIVEGLPYFAFPQKMKAWMRKIMEIPIGYLRRFGFGSMLIGLWLVYLGTR